MSKQGIIIVVLIVVVVGAGLWYALSTDKGQISPSNGENKVVATVNGEEITNQEFQSQLSQTKQMYSQQSQNVDEKQLKQQLLDQMIGNILIKQKAEEKGLSVDKSEIDSRIDQMVKSVGGEEKFDQQLKSTDLTREKLRERIKEQILAQKYMESEIPESELEVTDKDIKDYLSKMKSQQQQGEGAQPSIPSFEEMEDQQKQQLKSQLKQQQRSTKLQEMIQNFRKQADVQTSL